MRVLFLTARQLDDPRGGGTIKSAAVLAYLEQRHDVDVATFGTGWERDAGRTVTIPLERPRSIGRLVASYARRIPLSIERTRSPQMASAVARLVGDRPPEAVLVDGWLMAQYLPEGFTGRRVLHQHNAEHRMWRRQADLERSPWRRAAIRAEAARVERYERRILGRFDVVLAVSEPDRRALLALGAPPPVPLLPNVPAPSLLEREPLDPIAEPVVVHLGTLSWPPNLDGVDRFLREGMPALRAAVPRARLVVAGSGAPASLRALAARTPGVELAGAPDDDEPLYRGARCFLDAGLGGAGTRVKILNAMARGLPVVATRDAAEGLEVEPGRDLLVVDDPRSAAGAIARVLRDDDTWRSLSRHGRAVIAERFRPEVAFAALEPALGGDD
jgi:glycosyltransferase involved in cell wall biosynthesis